MLSVSSFYQFQHGPCAFRQWALLLAVGFFTFTTVGLHAATCSPFLLFLSLFTFTRCSSWPLTGILVGLVVATFLPLFTYSHVCYVKYWILVLEVVGLPAVAILDRFLCRKFLQWAVSSPWVSNRFPSVSAFCYVRLFAFLLVSPCLLAANFYSLEFLPYPWDFASTYSPIFPLYRTDFILLGAIGGMPLILFTVVFFCSTLVLLGIVLRVDEKSFADSAAQATIPLSNYRTTYASTISSSSSVSNSASSHSTSVIENPTSSLLAPMERTIVSGPSTYLPSSFSQSISVLRKAVILPLLVASLLLVAGPILRLVGDGTFVHVDVKTLNSGLPQRRIACLPNGFIDTQIIEKAVNMGSDLIVTAESTMSGLPEPRLGNWTRAQSAARMFHVPIGEAYRVGTGPEETTKNMFSLYDIDGNLVLQHQKFHPTPMEPTSTRVKPNITVVSTNVFDQRRRWTQTQKTPQREERKLDEATASPSWADDYTSELLGIGEVASKQEMGVIGNINIGSAICYDFYSSVALTQSGRQNVDLLLAPSFVWRSLHESHRAVMQMRAVENGAVLFTCTHDGISGAFGPYGEVYASRYTVGNGPYIFDVPVHPQQRAWSINLYPWIAKFQVWVYLAVGGCATVLSFI